MKRPDREGAYRSQFETNKRIILATQELCAICGKPVDKSIRYPNPLSPSVDHIIPIARGGHPSDLSNLQLAHRICNRAKGTKLQQELAPQPAGDHPVVMHSRNWKSQ